SSHSISLHDAHPIFQALAKSNKIELLAGSSFDRAYDPSRVLVERHLECPALGDPGFRARFEALLRCHAVDLVFPTVDAVVAELADRKSTRLNSSHVA